MKGIFGIFKTQEKLNKSYTNLSVPQTKNKGRVHYLGQVCGIPLILQPLQYSIYSLIIVVAYNALAFKTLMSNMTASTWNFAVFLQVAITFLILSVTFIDPGFVSYPVNLDLMKPQCNLCFTTKSDNASHCYISGICVRDFDHFCIVLGNCFTSRNSQRIYLLVALAMCHMTLLFAWKLSFIN